MTLEPDFDEDAARDGGAQHEIRTGFDGVVAWVVQPLSWLIFIAFAVSVYEVIARYVFDSPTLWAHETTTFLIAVIFLVGGPIALARNKHIRVRMFYDKVGPAGRRMLDIVNSIIALVFFAGLSYAAWTMAWGGTHGPAGEFRLERTGTGWNPPVPAFIKIVILICVVVMAIQTVLHLLEAIRRDTGARRDR
jgi:TRAP-type mannitol/chloroaromatic compound transport system permease small subunit